MNNLLKMTGFVPVILGMLCACQSTSTEQHNDTYIEDLYEALPFDMPVVQRPSFPDYQVDIRDFGAKADGETLNTEAINNAIKAVSEKGGGKVVIPEGLWLTGPVVLQNNVNLHVEKNALVLFSGDADLYPLVRTSFEGLDMLRCQSPISAMNAENIAITGHGVLDGSGDSWRPVKRNKMTDGQWKSLLKSGGVVDESGKVWYPNEGALKASILTGSKEKREISDSEWEGMKRWLRPVLLSIVKSKRVLLEGVTFRNSPSWCLHPLSCEDLTLNGVKVFNPWYSQNGDALDVESCKNVVVTNSLFDAGDDAICIKSGKDADGRRRGEPCENVLVKNNTVLHGHGGFVVGIGSEMSGGVRNVYVADCTFIGTDVGLRFKSTRGRGGVVENVYVDNINMINIPGDALIADLYYAVKDAPGAPVPAVTEETPSFKNIHISNISCKGAGRAMFLNGLPEMPIENFSVRNMRITDAQKGAFINKVAGVTLENIEIETADNTYLQVENTTNITIDGKEYDKISEKRLLTQN